MPSSRLLLPAVLLDHVGQLYNELALLVLLTRLKSMFVFPAWERETWGEGVTPVTDLELSCSNHRRCPPRRVDLQQMSLHSTYKTAVYISYSILGLGLSLLSMEAVSGHLSAGLSPLQVRSRRWPRSWRDTLGLGCLGRICWWVRRGWRGELCSGHRSRFCGSQADTVGTSWTPSSAPSPGPAPRAGWSPWPAAGQTLKQIVSPDPPHNSHLGIFIWEKKGFYMFFPTFSPVFF